MKKRYIFIFLLALLAFLVIQLLVVGYRNSSREDLLNQRRREIQKDEQEIAYMTLRARWWDTSAARIYLRKLYEDVVLPGEKIVVLIPAETPKYSVEQEINIAKLQDKENTELTIPEKWNKLFRGTRG